MQIRDGVVLVRQAGSSADSDSGPVVGVCRTCGHARPMEEATLRTSLSGTFLQILPDLVTPLKGHSLSPCSCPPTRSAHSERFGY